MTLVFCSVCGSDAVHTEHDPDGSEHTRCFKCGKEFDVFTHEPIPSTTKIAVMRVSMPDSQLPDLFLNTSKGIEEQLEASFLGFHQEWRDAVGDKIVITFEEMNVDEFNALPAWDEA